MPRKAAAVETQENQFDMNSFLEALEADAKDKELKEEDIVAAIEEAFKAAYVRYLGGGVKDMPDPEVVCHVDLNNHEQPIELAQIKKVRDDVQDDMLEIETDEANEGLAEPKYKDGDDYVIPFDFNTITKPFFISFRNNFRQKVAEAERSALYEIYKDRIGEMMTGTVERADDHGIAVNIGRTTVELGRHELIGDETFRQGDQVKVYIQEVKSAQPTADGKKPRGPQIEATRSSEGFLKRLFEDEIHEIYDGTVVIKAVARKAGFRSKIAVYSNNEDVDATGACIGQGGSRIQKIVSQLGNGKSKEKIDVISWSDDLALFVAESVRPAQALGVHLEPAEEEGGKPTATVIIHDGDYPVAMGKFKSNIELAKKLTGCDIEFVEETAAEQDGVEFTPIEELRAKAQEEKKEREKQAFAKKSQEDAERRAQEAAAALLAQKEAEEKARREQEEAARKQAEEAVKPKVEPIIPAVAPKASANPDEFPMEAMNPAAAALAALKASQEAPAQEAAPTEEAPATQEQPAEPVSEEKPVEEAKPEEHAEVKTTTTLSDLEAALNSSKEKKTKPAKRGRPKKITEAEVPNAAAKHTDNAIPVYTEEQLAEIEKEEANTDLGDSETDENIDEEYGDYDQYYDDSGK